MTLIDKAETQSAVRAYLVHESSEIALNVEQIIAALPARGVGVKPLDWVELEVHDITVFEALTCLGRYKVQDRAVPGWMLVGTNGVISVHDSEAAAKAAAQADYEARILDALTPTDAAHVNETPKSEHDGADVLTAAQAREAHLREAAAAVRARYMGDNNREDQEVLRCEAAIIALIGDRP